MEIKIDTNDILGDETTIREEVIAKVSSALRISIAKQSKETVQAALDGALNDLVKERVNEIVELHIDAEYTVADEYGRNEKTSTIRQNIADIIQKQCVFKNSRYDSDRNAFSSAVVDLVGTEVKKFRAEFTSLVNHKLVNECLDDATKKLKAACGIG